MLAEPDLHGLVDGYIEPERRVEALRRLAASPIDRARVEAWQGQNDLLRSAFSGIVREALPPMLDLTTKAQLNCIPADVAPVVAPAFVTAPLAPTRFRRCVGAFAALVVVVIGLGASWAFLDASGSDVADGTPHHGLVETALATRSSEVVKLAAGIHSVSSYDDADSLPTTDIPDLHLAGFSFIGADTAAKPSSIVFRYRNNRDEQLAVTVAGGGASTNGGFGTPVRIGDAFSWRKGNKAYAIAGTVRPERLKALASALQRDDSQ